MILNHGRILDQDSPLELIRRHVEPEVVEVRCCSGSPPDLEEARRLPGRMEKVGDTVFFYSDNAHAILDHFRDSHDLTCLMRPANLEDVFLKLTGRELRD